MSIEDVIFGIVLVAVFGGAYYIVKDARKQRLRGPGHGMGSTPFEGGFGSDFGGGDGGGGGSIF